VHDEASIDIDRLSCHMGGAVGGEENDHIGNGFGSLPFAERHNRTNFAIRPLIVAQPACRLCLVMPGLPDGAVQRGLYHARTDGVHPDAVRGDIPGEALRKIDVRRFGGAVRWVRLRTYLSSNRGHKHHRASSPRDHVGRDRMRDLHHPHHVHVKHAQPVVRLKVGEGKAELSRSDRGGMHQMIDWPERRNRLFQRRPYRRLVGHIDGHARCGHRESCVDFACRLLHCLIAVPERNAGPFGGKPVRGCAANAACAACDNDDMIIEFQVHIGYTEVTCQGTMSWHFEKESSYEIIDDRAMHIGQAAVDAVVTKGEALVVDAELVQHGGVQIVAVGGIDGGFV
jgi:hypothetical protein